MNSILLIDDDPDIIEIVKELVQTEGYKCYEASNGIQAIEVLKKVTCDLIILDLWMPGMNGIEFLKKIHKNKRLRGIPMLVMTGTQNNALLRKALELGAVGFLKKPIDFSLLKAKISSLLRFSVASHDQAILLRGDLSQKNLENLIEVVEKRGLSGNLVLDCDMGQGQVEFKRGILENAVFNGKKDSSALDDMMRWQSGDYYFDQNSDEETSLINEVLEITSSPAPIEKSYTEPDTDHSMPVQIRKNVYSVGARKKDRLLQTNAYLCRYDENICHLIDPGPLTDYEIINQKISKVTGDISKIEFFSFTHPEPEVVSNAIHLRSENPKASCFTTLEIWGQISGLGIKKNRVILIENLKNQQAQLTTGHKIQFLKIPFCHSRGALAVYDLESRILFSGDLFSSLNEPGNLNLYANADCWEGIKAFHQIYMPSSKALKSAIGNINNLDPKPKMIAPHHGLIIKEEFFEYFFSKLFKLKMGSDLLHIGEDKSNRSAYEEIIMAVFDKARELTNEPERILYTLQANLELNSIVEFDKRGIKRVRKDGRRTLELLTMSICHSGIDVNIGLQVKAMAIKEAITRNLAPPVVSLKEGDDEMIEMRRQWLVDV